MRFFFSTYTALAVALGVTALSPDLAERSASPLTGTAVIPFFDLPTLVANAPCAAQPDIVEAIRTTLALYPLSIDGKNFNALSEVFTSNAVANYSAPLNVLTPLSTIQSVLQASLAAVNTQHAFATQLIDVLSPTSAFSVTYYTATHFGRGPFLGATATAYGQYQDVWAKQSDASWKITHRNLVYMVSPEFPHESSSFINHLTGASRRKPHNFHIHWAVKARRRKLETGLMSSGSLGLRKQTNI
jgi:ketosteroid isomerase-like protein